jgi:hypothetical protein
MRLLHSLAIIVVLLSTSSLNNSWATVGKVTEQTGPTEIIREKKSIPSSLNTGVQMNDTVSTAKAKAQLTFEDNTQVKLTEHSKIVIDDFVYDPKKGTGKLAMKVALGTARYASGQIAKNNPQQVAIKTPTASIAVRGTDFTMTVDELGRSLIVLLPSCDEKGCVTGSIEVSNLGGVVILDVPYQATLVATQDSPPSAPVVVKIDQANINNMLIISKPPEVQDESEIKRIQKTSLDFNELDIDLLKFNGLDRSELDAKNSLDRNDLNADLLDFYSNNELDKQNSAFLTNELENPILPSYSFNRAAGLMHFFNETQTEVTLYKVGTHNANIMLSAEKNSTLSLTQDGQTIVQNVNAGGSNILNITQK